MSRPLVWKTTCRVLSCRTHGSWFVVHHTKGKRRVHGTVAGPGVSLSETGGTCGSRYSKSMDMCASAMDRNNSNALHGSFCGETVEDLDTWLQERGIKTELFGTVHGSKTLQCLLHEVAEGESLLETTIHGEPLRMVSIISVNIKNKRGQSLYETRQRLPGGGVRERNLLLSEKLLPNESWKDATRRGIMEELGSILPENPDIDVLDDTYSKNTERSTSSSYPGLCTEYVCHKVEARVSGLPETDFVTEESRPDGVLLSSWAWRHASPL